MERKLYAVGDIHGKFATFKQMMGAKTDSDFILVGDIQLGFHSNEIYADWFPKWNEELKRDLTNADNSLL